MPFVFAAWVSKNPMPGEFIEKFDRANAIGLEHIDEIVASLPADLYDMKKYYSLHLSYQLDERKRMGMMKFLDVIDVQQEINVR